MRRTEAMTVQELLFDVVWQLDGRDRDHDAPAITTTLQCMFSLNDYYRLQVDCTENRINDGGWPSVTELRMPQQPEPLMGRDQALLGATVPPWFGPFCHELQHVQQVISDLKV